MLNKKLIAARKMKRWTQADLASRLKVTPVTISRWENGIQVPQAYYVRQLCQLFAATDRDLGFALCQDVAVQEYRMVYEEMDRFFTFGRIRTAELILDGDGTGIYLPKHIHSHYIPVPLELPEEIVHRKEQIAKEQEERKAQGDSYQWNGERYNLSKFNIGRDPASEDMILGLWFRPSDYYTFLAASEAAQDQTIREKYLADVEWDEAVPAFAHSFSVLLTVITCDGQTILVQRGKGMGCRPNVFDVSIAEGLSRPVDRSGNSQAPDVYRCAVRGLAEELGLHEPSDFAVSDILLLSFAVDTEFCMWGLFGMAKLKRSTQEVLENLRRSTRDRFEHRRVFSVPFTPEEICSFVFSHEPFSPGGLICLYHALVHEFGTERVDDVIASY